MTNFDDIDAFLLGKWYYARCTGSCAESLEMVGIEGLTCSRRLEPVLCCVPVGYNDLLSQGQDRSKQIAG